jgi:hypothetical protein
VVQRDMNCPELHRNPLYATLNYAPLMLAPKDSQFLDANTAVKKPRVIWMVILSFIGSVLGFCGGIPLLGLIAVSDITAFGYVMMVLGVISFVSAILLLRYKRVGLYLAAVSHIGTVLIFVYFVASGSNAFLSPLYGLPFDAAVLYYVYVYLARTPQKTFFS